MRSLVSAYQQWWRLYTLTDATGQESQQVERDRITPAFFDFGLMVQTVDKEKVESQKEKEEGEKEKIERLPVLEGICKYAVDHVLLVGRPGSGKSTALARLLLQEAENALSIARAKIPVLVELRYLPSEANESSVCDRILAFMHKHDPALDIDEAGIKQLLRQRQLLLLVDGVNELPSDRGRVMVNQFRELYQKTCPMIFTTRELSAGGDLGIAKRLEMQPLTEPQMQQFVMAYLPTQGERLLQQLSGRLREFGQTPLLLWMLCSLFQQSEQIPPNLGMVFRAFTVGYRDSKKELLSERLRTWCGRLLQYLAFKMTCGKNLTDARVAISRQQAESILVEFLKGKVEYPDDCAIRWLNDLLKHHLIQANNDLIEFEHQLIQEYYAAEWLFGLLENQQISYERLQHDYLNYLKWTEPLALMLDLLESDDEEKAVRVVKLSLEVDLRLGARLAGAVKYGFQEKTVELLIREIDERKIPQLYAIELFGETRSDVAIEYLKSLNQTFKNEDYILHREIAKVIGNNGGDKDIKILIQYLSKDYNHVVRAKAAEALGKIGRDKDILSLIKALKDEDFIVRAKVAEALGIIGSDKAVESLIECLRDQTSFVRKNVVDALAKIGNDKAIQSLIDFFKEDWDISDLAIDALGKFTGDKAEEILIQTSKNENILVRRKALTVLGKIGSDRAIATIIQALKHDNEYSIRESAVQALSQFSSNQNIDLLIQVLNNDENYWVREAAAKALGSIGSYRAIEPLIEALKNRSSNVSSSAADALGLIGSSKAIEPLIQALKNRNPTICSSATKALGKIGSNEAVKPLIKALSSHNHQLCSIAAKALGKIGSEESVEPLIHILQTQNEDIRCSVSEALGNISSEKSVEPLIQYLDDDFVRRKVVEALGKIGSKKAIDPIIKVLNSEIQYSDDADYVFCEKAAEALKKIGSDKAEEILMQHLNNEDFIVRKRATEALGNIGSYKAVELLVQDLKDNDVDGVHWVTVEALRKIAVATIDKNVAFLSQKLPQLVDLIPKVFVEESNISAVITAIQTRCKYYNYNIAQTPSPPEDKPKPTTGNTYIFKAPVDKVVAGNLIVHGNNIATQNNQKTAPDS
ncbi:HEAT repeat domain-containing protein [Pseudanabaena yagii]|uniref:NACHT domain-containing protein n=1 Tax=Pseudanabaena yagii GIHE-NHR1 TaxID=2722753 RepID=A0ABX1LNS5_9CYAN|nr:HEAT repeat domain-containing protein [Pseudanabaena yagii]NMF57784.1 NACHT domain-containing protein [Pseudanabaena yagii GIHE-NHR1]